MWSSFITHWTNAIRESRMYANAFVFGVDTLNSEQRPWHSHRRRHSRSHLRLYASTNYFYYFSSVSFQTYLIVFEIYLHNHHLINNKKYLLLVCFRSLVSLLRRAIIYWVYNSVMVLPSKKYKIDYTENSYRWIYYLFEHSLYILLAHFHIGLVARRCVSPFDLISSRHRVHAKIRQLRLCMNLNISCMATSHALLRHHPLSESEIISLSQVALNFQREAHSDTISQTRSPSSVSKVDSFSMIYLLRTSHRSPCWQL